MNRRPQDCVHTYAIRVIVPNFSRPLPFSTSRSLCHQATLFQRQPVVRIFTTSSVSRRLIISRTKHKENFFPLCHRPKCSALHCLCETWPTNLLEHTGQCRLTNSIPDLFPPSPCSAKPRAPEPQATHRPRGRVKGA